MSVAPGYNLATFATNPAGTKEVDSIVTDGQNVYVGYGNGTAKNGSDGKFSTIVQYDSSGAVVQTFNVQGHNDGLKVDPATHKVWALQNEDANPNLVVIDPVAKMQTNYTMASLNHGGGFDDITFVGGHIYMSVSNPQLATNTDPAVVEVSLGATSVNVLRTVILGNVSGQNLLDPDSMTSNPAGDLVLVSQSDNLEIIIHNPSTTPTVTVVPTKDASSNGVGIDDTLFTPANTAGSVLMTDQTAGIIYRITGPAITAGPVLSAARDIGQLGTFNFATGAFTPVISGLGSPRGLAFLQAPYQHVLILSIDGLHQADLTDPATSSSLPTIASLQAGGITYTNDAATKPSDSFPGTLALLTGAHSKTTGVYYDDSYDRSLAAPGSPQGATPGTETQYAENIDQNQNNLNGLNTGVGGFNASSIDTTQLPVDPVTGKPVYPHDFVQVNNIYEIATAAGLRTAFSDKHPAYDIANGPSNSGVTDLFTPEINSKFAIDTNYPTHMNPLAILNDPVAKTFLADGNYNPDSLPLVEGTKSDTLTLAYDDVKVRAILNEIDGKNSLGTTTMLPTPALMYMNFQGVSVAQKDFVNGGITVDSMGNETVSPELLAALGRTDASIGKIVAELKLTGQFNNTLIVVTAKHGQDPRVGAAVNVLASKISDALNGASPAIDHFAVQDDVALIWLNDKSRTGDAQAVLQGLQASGTHPEIDRILAGHAVIQLGSFGDPTKPGDTRTPDIVIQLNPGFLYVGNPAKPKRAEHGGFSEDDTHVPLIVSSGGLGAGLKGSVQTTAVENTQIAVTALQALGLDPNKLQGAVAEGTQALPTAIGGLSNTTTFTATQKYVNQAYVDLFHRAADTGGLNNFAGQLDSKALTQQQFVAALENSPEYRSVEVNDLYKAFLHRNADPTGLAGWTALLASGHRVEEVESGIVSSPEYFTNAGGTNAGFLDSLYHDVLNRGGDAGGLAGYLSDLTSGKKSRADVAAGFFGSDEFHGDLVQSMYRYYLGRKGEAAGVNGYANQLKMGATVDTVIAEIVSSPEFVSLANKGI